MWIKDVERQRQGAGVRFVGGWALEETGGAADANVRACDPSEVLG